MLFNVSREKSGKLGRSGDVMDVVRDAVSLSPPTRPHNLLHVEKLASTVNGTAAQCTSQCVQVKRTVSKTITKGARDQRCTWGESLDSPSRSAALLQLSTESLTCLGHLLSE